MLLDWFPRDNEEKSHQLFGDEFFGTDAPCTVYERKPLVNPNTGETVWPGTWLRPHWTWHARRGCSAYWC